jgi:hypothetical protein
VPGSQFTGTFYLAERRPSAPRSLRRDEIAGARLQFTLTPAMAGRSFPLATTGKPGAADVLFLRVTPQGNAVLGYDHWGSAPIVSAEIPVGFGQPHTLEFRLPALSAPHAAPDVTVSLDGKEIWQQRVPFHRPAPENIHFTQNPIGATSCEPTFPEATLENVLVPSWRG